MAWINPPPPPDDEVLITSADGTTWTWGEHRQMEAWLKELEADDPVTAAARKKLDDTMIEAGIKPDERVIRVCEFCGVEEFTIHNYGCPSARDDVTGREAGGYQYLDENFQPVWTTSVPRTDEFALQHFKNIQMMHEDINVCYILRRPMHSNEYSMMPFRFDRTLGEEGEVVPIVRPGA